MAEALGARECVVWAASRGFRNFIMEGDSLQIVAALNDSSTNVSPFEHIIEDSKSLLAAITEDLSARCQANTVAHRIARFSLNIGSHFEWLVHAPSFTIDLLMEDVM